MNKLKTAYFGTPTFSARLLRQLLDDSSLPIDIKLVVTRPDKPVGRKQIRTPSPVKRLAMERGIEVEHTIKNTKSRIVDFDLAILFAYGRIIPKDLLEIPTLGFWNIHPSLLPLYRGPSPIAYPLLLGDQKTGVTLMQMDEEMDHGPLISQEEYIISPEKSRGDLENELTDLGFRIIKKTLLKMAEIGEGTKSRLTQTPLLKRTSPPSTFQKHEDATYTKLLEKKDGFIDPRVLRKSLANQPIISAELPEIVASYAAAHPQHQIQNKNSAALVYNLFRALPPWPGIWTTVNIDGQKKRLKILGMKLDNNILYITQVQLEGKNPVPYSTFQSAYPGAL